MAENKIIPFFINSNIPNQNDLKTYKSFMEECSGNTGNSYITYALIKELEADFNNIHHIKSVYTYNFDNSDIDIDFINNTATHVFLVLQDQIRVSESYGLKLPYEKIQNFIGRINKPVIIAGLCANCFEGEGVELYKKLSPELINFLKFLSDHCIEIGVRGDFTHEILNKIGIYNVRTIGCPSYFENGRKRLIVKKDLFEKDKILVTSGFYLESLFTNHHVMQAVEEEKYINPICFNDFRYEYSDIEFDNFLQNKYHIFTNGDDWKSFARTFHLALGSRLHGAIAAINSGIPAICTNQDLRAIETCGYLKIPNYKDITDETDFLKLYEELNIDEQNAAYPKLYDNYVDFMNKNNLVLSDANDDCNIEEYKIPSVRLYKRGFLLSLLIKRIKVFCNITYNKLCSKIKRKYTIMTLKYRNFKRFIDSKIRRLVTIYLIIIA